MRPASRPLHILAILARLAGVLAILGATGIAMAGCKRSSTDGGQASVSLPRVDGARTDLLFSWVDERGDVHVESKATEVPESARSMVRVVDPDVEAPGGKIFLVDLGAPRGDGTFPVRVAARDELESVIEARRKANGTALTAGSAVPKPPAQERPPVIVYGASWCGPCHQVEAYLKQRGVPFVHKDIEHDPGADQEMRAKLAKAGKGGGSIPVVDVRGQLLVGYDPGSLGRALERRD